MTKFTNDVLLVKAREHKRIYVENIEDVRLAYVDSFLRTNGINTHIVDFSFYSTSPDTDSEILAERVKLLRPSIIIFFIDKHPTNGPAYTIELLMSLLQKNNLPNTHITLYGSTHIDIQAFFNTSFVNSVILGEEESALSLVNCVLNNRSLDKVEGIAYINQNGVISINPANLKMNLDNLPFPTRYVLNKNISKPYCASILTSRGCFGKCSYCYLRSKEKYFGRYPLRMRSIKNIIEEIESLYKLGVKEYYFSDDEFLQKGTVGIERIEEFVNAIKERQLQIKFSIYSRSDCITEENIKTLSSVGLYCVFLGVESFCSTVLDRYNKGLTVEDNLNAIEILKKYNIHIRLGMIMFDPQTTIDELRHNIQVLKEIMATKPELIFQSLFFSNALIPLDNTPSISLIKDNGSAKVFNNAMQENYTRRSRAGRFDYSFSDDAVSGVYTCVEFMANKLLYYCMEYENKFYNDGLSRNAASKLLYITRFTVELFDLILTDITGGVNTETCNTRTESIINTYFQQ